MTTVPLLRRKPLVCHYDFGQRLRGNEEAEGCVAAALPERCACFEALTEVGITSAISECSSATRDGQQAVDNRPLAMPTHATDVDPLRTLGATRNGHSSGIELDSPPASADRPVSIIGRHADA